MDEQTARQEAIAFATGPGQAITYQIGKLQILKFLADARMQLGDRFNLRAFHDFVWKNGNVPIALQEWELLGDANGKASMRLSAPPLVAAPLRADVSSNSGDAATRCRF